MPGTPPTLQKGIRTAALRRVVVGGGVAGSGRFNRSRNALSQTALMPGYHIQIVLNPENSPSTSHQPHPDSFIPASLFQPLPSHSPRSTLRRDTLSRPISNKDYRTGPIRVDWIDFEQMSSILHGGKKAKEHGRGPVEATFVPHARNKSGTTNLPEGTVHVFRDGSSKPSPEELEAKVSEMSISDLDSDGVMLGVLAVPSWMTPSDFLAFVAPAVEGIGHLRIIRDVAPNRSLVVLRFFKPTDAAEFSEAYNGKPFNSMEPEICHVVRVLSVVIDVDDTASQTIFRLGASQGTLYELPTCPVCLERMDSAITGLITVPCSHTFHCMCLSKWGDSRCPVCRYSQTLLSSHPSSVASRGSSHSIPFADPSSNYSVCSCCSSTTNLWICLICGNIGCGRYGQAHAQAHYQSTTHLYALELETQRVWDYAGDGYVHRLIQNKADGKLVELPSAASSMGVTPRDGGLGPSQADALSAEKVEAIGIEYSYLLTSQLDSQRSFYEEQTTDLKSKINELTTLVQDFSNKFEQEQTRHREEELKRQKEHEQEMSKILKEKSKADERADKITDLARKLEKELREEQAVSNGLMKNLAVMRQKAEFFDKEREDFSSRVRELEDQVRDVMFFLEAKTKIEQGGGIESEAAGGSVSVPDPPKSNNKKKKSRKDNR